MANENLEKVDVLFADTKAEIRRLMSDALRNYGLRNVRGIPGFKELRGALASNVPADLIVLDPVMRPGDPCELIAALRKGEIGENPFIPVIATVWNPDDGLVRKVIDSGVDHVLAAPVTPIDLFKRIDALINDRKPFVVTSDYIGPDRRRDPNRGDSKVPLIDAPNTLRLKARGEKVDPADIKAAIDETVAEVNDQRLVRHSYQINLLVEMILPAYENDDVTPVIRVHMEKLVEVAEDVARRLEGSRFEHAGEMCTNLRTVATSICENWEEPNRKDVELLKPLSQAILASFNPDRDSAEMASEITGMVSKFSGKINQEAMRKVG